MEWLTISKSLVRSIDLVNVQSGVKRFKALGYFMCKRQEGRYVGVVGTEAMLVGERK